jgi:ribonucleoside-diphosphate reductase beta chain
MNIFEPRKAYKPFDYPEVMTFVDAINKSFWVHSEVDFTADIQDFNVNLSYDEQQIVTRSLLAIAQIEVAVKTFWGNLYSQLPKPEFNGLGSTFAECEFRHSEAYSRLIEVLGKTSEFDTLLEVPVINTRLDYLQKCLQYAKSDNKNEFIHSLIMFTILIENVSLFSQFATILSFTKFKGYLKNVANIIAWTSVDEQIHANAGIWIVKQIMKEQPNLVSHDDIANILFTKFKGYLKNVANIIAWTSVDEQIHANAGIWIVKQIMKEQPNLVSHDDIANILLLVKESIAVESNILDWVFEDAISDTINKEDLLAYMKSRINLSLKELSMPVAFNTDETKNAANLFWFEEEVFANSLDDFFAKRPTEYTKHDKSITANDLF